MSRKGNFHNNLVVESFFLSAKKEKVQPETQKTRNQTHLEIFDYIECFYNFK